MVIGGVFIYEGVSDIWTIFMVGRLTKELRTRLGKPKEFQRFLIQAASCLDHDAWGELSRIAGAGAGDPLPPLFGGGGPGDGAAPAPTQDRAQRPKES